MEFKNRVSTNVGRHKLKIVEGPNAGLDMIVDVERADSAVIEDCTPINAEVFNEWDGKIAKAESDVVNAIEDAQKTIETTLENAKKDINVALGQNETKINAAITNFSNQMVNTVSDQSVYGTKVFSNLYATDDTISPFINLGNRYVVATQASGRAILKQENKYYIVALYKKQLEMGIYKTAIIKYDIATNSIDKIYDLRPKYYKNLYITSLEVRGIGNGGIVACVHETNEFTSGSQIKNYFLSLNSHDEFTFDINAEVYSMSKGISLDFSSVDGELAMTTQETGLFYLSNNREIYEFNYNNRSLELIYTLEQNDGYGIEKVFVNRLTYENQSERIIWLLVKSSPNKAIRINLENGTKKTINFLNNGNPVDMTDDLEFGMIHFFTDDNQLYSLSKLFPLNAASVNYYRNENQMKYYAHAARNGEVYILCGSSGSSYPNTTAMQLTYYSLSSTSLVTIGEIKGVRFDTRIDMIINDDNTVTIAGYEGIFIKINPKSVQEYMIDLDSRLKRLDMKAGDTIVVDDRYLELRGGLADLEESSIKVGDKISGLVNDKNYQTPDQVISIVGDAINAYLPAGGGNNGESNNVLLWQGRVREDSIWGKVPTGSMDRNEHVWQINSLMNFHKLSKNDKMRIHLETDPITTSDLTNYIDKVTLDYKVEYADEVLASNIFIGIEDDYNITMQELSLYITNWTMFLMNSNIEESGFSFKFSKADEYTFANFSKLRYCENIMRYVNDLVEFMGERIEDFEGFMNEVGHSNIALTWVNNTPNSSIYSFVPYWQYEDENSLSTAVKNYSINISPYSSDILEAKVSKYGYNKDLYYITKIEVVKG